jgi:hypothetical protein
MSAAAASRLRAPSLQLFELGDVLLQGQRVLLRGHARHQRVGGTRRASPRRCRFQQHQAGAFFFVGGGLIGPLPLELAVQVHQFSPLI